MSHNYIGVIFNTDPHNKPGVHWVAVFIDNRNKIVDYFDSLGNTPNKNICSFLKRFKKALYHWKTCEQIEFQILS
jgi:Ulp1 family protease